MLDGSRLMVPFEAGVGVSPVVEAGLETLTSTGDGLTTWLTSVQAPNEMSTLTNAIRMSEFIFFSSLLPRENERRLDRTASPHSFIDSGFCWIISTRPSSRIMLPFIVPWPQQLPTVRTPPAFNAATIW